MGRGERHMKSDVAERKCIVTGEVQPKHADPFCRVARQKLCLTWQRNCQVAVFG